MLKTYDSTLQAYTEHPPKHHDTALNAWVESPSAKTFDKTINAWVERLYQGFFTLQDKQLESADSFQINLSEITLFTAQSSASRRIQFKLPFVWNGDTVEFNLTTNGVASVYFGSTWYAESGKSVSGPNKIITESHNGYVSVQLGATPTEIDGSPVVSSELYIQITGGSASEMGYVYLSDLKISGKKYGFRE